MIQGISWAIKGLQLGKTKLLWEWTVQHFCGEWWVCPLDHSIQVLHSFVFYHILEFVHLPPHFVKLALHSWWVFFWHSRLSVRLAIRSFLIVVSFDLSTLVFILVLQDPLSFLVLGFSDSPQFFVLVSHFLQGGCQGWICCAACSAFISCYKVLFCHVGKMALNDQRPHKWRQTDDVKNHQVEDLVSQDGRSRGVLYLWSKPIRKLEKECNTSMWCLPKTFQCLSQKGREWCREKNGLEKFLGEYLCIPLDYVVPFFYNCFPFFMDNEFWHLWATASMSWMGALNYTTHLLSLLRPLFFIINACNKCIMLVWIVIDM